MRSRRIPAILILVVPALVACVDPTHDQQVQALGGEAPGVPPGPEHRPGQPCLVCHGGSGPASSKFSIAGTVYAAFGQLNPAVGATVQIEDITGAGYLSQTNSAGNFYISSSAWQPTYPTGRIQVSLGSISSQMQTHVGRDGSCGTCHLYKAGATSPGPIYVNTMVGSADSGTSP